ncbi:hypothetical protein BOW14_12785, partial [Solemya velum gill symbiont]|uniref:hypothetical protein n=1 Tax=Solemya velum gill symbiont TaxID=2340 RepID=UPI0009CD3C06
AYGGCPAYKEAKEIGTLAATERIPFSQAKRIVTEKKSFASIVTGSEKTQTVHSAHQLNSQVNIDVSNTKIVKTPTPKATILTCTASTQTITESQSVAATQTRTTEGYTTSSTQTDKESNQSSTEQMVLFFIQCMSIMNKNPTLDFQCKVKELAQTMFGLAFSPESQEVTESPAMILDPPADMPISGETVSTQVDFLSQDGDHTYSCNNVQNRAASRSRSRSDHRNRHEKSVSPIKKQKNKHGKKTK